VKQKRRRRRPHTWGRKNLILGGERTKDMSTNTFTISIHGELLIHIYCTYVVPTLFFGGDCCGRRGDPPPYDQKDPTVSLPLQHSPCCCYSGTCLTYVYSSFLFDLIAFYFTLYPIIIIIIIIIIYNNNNKTPSECGQ
jgi:hypothetical protein